MLRIILALMLTATTVQAQEPLSCLPHIETFIAELQKRYGETPQSIGMSGTGGAVFTFANPATGSWSIVGQAPDGKFCIIMFGIKYRTKPSGKPA